MRLASPGVTLESVQGRWRMQGQANVELVAASSRLSTLDTLGSYDFGGALKSETMTAHVRIDPETFQRAIRLYHQMEGWDPETGWPTFAKLAELGIEWAAKPGETW